MKDMKKIILAFAACVFLFSCKEEPIPGHPYDGADYVYYANHKENRYTVWRESKYTEIVAEPVLINAVGGIYPEERTFSYKLVPTANTYKGEDINIGDLQLPPENLYKIYDNFIPANSRQGHLGLTFVRDHNFMMANKGMEWRFDIVLVPDENFEVWETGDIDGNGKAILSVTLGVNVDYNS